jgi:hypothetical protein
MLLQLASAAQPTKRGNPGTKQLTRLCEKLLAMYWPRFFEPTSAKTLAAITFGPGRRPLCRIDYLPVARENLPQEEKPRLIARIRGPGSAHAPCASTFARGGVNPSPFSIPVPFRVGRSNRMKITRPWLARRRFVILSAKKTAACGETAVSW